MNKKIFFLLLYLFTTKVFDKTCKINTKSNREILIDQSSFQNFNDGLSEEEFLSMLKGKSKEGDSEAIHFFGPGRESGQNFSSIFNDSNPTDLNNDFFLLYRAQINRLEDGTILEGLDGSYLIKGVDQINSNSGRLTKYGVRKSNIKSGQNSFFIASEGSSPIFQKLKEIDTESKALSSEIIELKKRIERKNMNNFSKPTEEIINAFVERNPNFMEEVKSQDPYRYGQSSKYLDERLKIETYSQKHSFTSASEIIKSDSSYNRGFYWPWKQSTGDKLKGYEALIMFEHLQNPYYIRGEIKEFSLSKLAFKIQIQDGSHFWISNDAHMIYRFDIKPSSESFDPQLPSKSIESIIEEEIAQNEDIISKIKDLEININKIRNLRDILIKGSPAVKFADSTAAERFYLAAEQIKKEKIIVKESENEAIKYNLSLNREFGRFPSSFTKSGIPVYSPGTSFFRAMAVSPENKIIAYDILNKYGWKSGKDRNVTIPNELIGSPGYGATRLNELAPLTDQVVEFVGPIDSNGEGFSFPRNSRIVGIASSPAVLGVALQTSNQNIEKGSFIMLTEIIPKAREVINSNRLFEVRSLKSKYPTSYDDGGIEFATTSIDHKEIINVIFIPIAN